jgi:hypothetical protein
MIKSKYRFEYWIRQVIQYVGTVIIIVLCISFSFYQGKIEFTNPLSWIAFIGTIYFIFDFSRFLINDLMKITLKENDILLKYFMLSRKETISFDHVRSFKTKQIRLSFRGGVTSGYEELEIELMNGTLITLNEDQYANYFELKYYIFKKLNKMQTA